MDRQKVDTKIGQLKDYAGELGQRVKEKHERVNVLAMLLEDLMKVRYGKDWRDVPKNNDVTPRNAVPKTTETLCQEELKP